MVSSLREVAECAPELVHGIADDDVLGTGGRVPVSQKCKTRILNS